MEELYQYQANLLRNVNYGYKRYLYSQLPWESRFLSIQGLRGVGKTTMMLQYLQNELKDTQKNLYVSMENPFFYSNSLVELAEEFVKYGGKTLLLDEVHKYANWSRELKFIYDSFPKLQVIFSSSSVMELFKGDADLSRRILRYELPGLSFREYLALTEGLNFPAFPLKDLLNDHYKISDKVLNKLHPLPLFKKYLKTGYFPFSQNEAQQNYQIRLNQVLETTLSVDLAQWQGFDIDTTYKIKELLGIIANTVPFTINVSSASEKMNIGRNTLKGYLHDLRKARVLNFLNRPNKGITRLQKPEKLYLENTNFTFALSTEPNVGAIRETFAVNQLINANYAISSPTKGDIYIDQLAAIFEIGGKNKTLKQISDQPSGYLLKDDIEVGIARSIPLWLLGFLY